MLDALDKEATKLSEETSLAKSNLDVLQTAKQEIETSKEVWKGYFGFLVEYNTETKKIETKAWETRKEILNDVFSSIRTTKKITKN